MKTDVVVILNTTVYARASSQKEKERTRVTLMTISIATAVVWFSEKMNNFCLQNFLSLKNLIFEKTGVNSLFAVGWKKVC